MIFKARKEAPSLNDRHYYSNENIYYASGVGMNKSSKNPNGGNCTAYAWGRLYELTNKRYVKLCGNGEQMYGNAVAAGLRVGMTPKLGAIICWRQGNTVTSSDGAGHVGVVEEIKPNGDLLVSESHWNGVNFDVLLVTKKSGYAYKSGFVLQGFIYCGIEFESPKEEETTTKEERIVRRLYIEVLNREADESGLKTYTNALKKGMTEDKLKSELLNSVEYRTDSTGMQKWDYIVRCYKNILNRYPENDNVVKQRLKWSDEQIFNDIWDSQEAKNRRA